MAREKLQDAIAAEGSAHEGVLAAESVLATANLELVHAMQACTEAKRAWLHAVAAETGAKEHVANVREDLDKALRLELHAERGRRVAEEEELSFRAAREFTAREDEEGGTEEEQGIEEEQEMDEESLRQAALAESIRKMEEINKIENAEKEEKEKKDREAAFAREERLKREREARAREIAERLARERDEAERVAREQREREEKQKRDAEDRLRLYQQAAAKECVRCQRRDLQFFPTVIWHNELAHERFLFVSAEFNSIKFQDSQPLTFESVPWPVLDRPHWMSLESIEWGAVEKFFRAMEEVLENETEYTALLEKAHRRFHPDKWKARGILKSILDQDLRDRLEAAGNVVAQAITPLWLKTRR
ncbi:hypothetical protein BC835DRAFT_690768 [Cytidiella melzeri]|nr:hypothetical protein BC835DRAFT_690768 [Cytidiella melzeri]